MDEHDDHADDRRAEWNTDPMADYPVGPDDAGNAVMHGMSRQEGRVRTPTAAGAV